MTLLTAGASANPQVRQALAQRPSVPFFVGPGGGPMTAAKLRAARAVEAALMQRAVSGTPRNVGEGLNALGTAIAYRATTDRNNEAEQAGKDQYAEMFGALGEDPTRDALMAVAPNGFETPAQKAIWDAEMAQELRGPDYQTMKVGNDILRWDQSDPNAEPNMFFDGPAYDAANVPSGYRPTADGTGYEPVPGGPADPANPLNTKRVGNGPMNPTTQKELFETEDSVTAGVSVVDALTQMMELNKTAYDGPISNLSGAAALLSVPGGKETELLANLSTEQALNQLKATFGAAPTEGERKILIELQGSVGQARNVREGIYKRALTLAQRRIEANKQKAAAIRSGEYFEAGYDSTTNGPAIGSIVDGYRFKGGDPSDEAAWEKVQ